MKHKVFMDGIKEGQKRFGETISAVINSVLLSIVYFIGVGITFVFARIFRKHFLELKLEKLNESYWEELNLRKENMGDYYRQF